MDDRTLENLKGLHRSYWDSASFSERLNALQKLEDYQARQQGRYRYEVKAFEPDDPGYKGLFVLDDDELEGTIYVNREHIADSGFQYEAINTVLHEGRHAYQFFSADRGLHHDPFEEERWIANSTNYVNPDDYVKYFFQPMERDAHYFSREEMNRVFSVLESEFGKSAYFGTYATLRDQQFQSIEKRAEERYGRDYIPKIDKAIGINEAQIRENLIEVGRIEPEQLEQQFENKSTPEFREQIYWMEWKTYEIEGHNEYPSHHRIVARSPEEALETLNDMNRESVVETSARTVREAEKKALEKLIELDGEHLRLFPIQYKVLQEPRQGFFGIGAREARVQAQAGHDLQLSDVTITEKPYRGEFLTEPQHVDSKIRSYDQLKVEPECIKSELDLHAEAEAAYHKKARFEEQLERTEKRSSGPDRDKKITSMRSQLQGYWDREGDSYAKYVEAKDKQVEQERGKDEDWEMER